MIDFAVKNCSECKKKTDSPLAVMEGITARPVCPNCYWKLTTIDTAELKRSSKKHK